MPHIVDISKEKINLQETESPQIIDEIHGLLVTFSDDQLNDCVNSALKKKSRVKYRCMDTFANFLAFGTSGGAIYLYKLKSMTHASCSLASIIACDQGSIEVVKFLPNPQTDDLLVAIGTSRGSIVVFRLCQLPGEQNPSHSELYRAELFTQSSPIKMIECDLDLLDPTSSFSRLYICDTENRLYCLESNYIYNSKQMLRLKFYVNNYLPTLILSLTDSNINQISVHRSQLLISTDETTRLFNDQNNQLYVIGKKKRKEGYYGACFFNPTFKPAQILPANNSSSRYRSSQQLASAYSSTNSLADLENLMIFVARPMFRLWQVNCKRTVMFTHQFESLIKSSNRNKLVQLSNEPLECAKDDDPTSIMKFIEDQEHEIASKVELKSDHFCKIVPIHSPTLGNLLLSHTKHELFIVDPIGAKLIAWYSQEDAIIQVCCNDSEVFIWSSTSSPVGTPNHNNNTIENNQQRNLFKVQRLVLLAPTQFVLELHRLHRYLTMMAFIERFESLFRRVMALPLSGVGIITTEGGLLRNVLINAWDIYDTQIRSSKLEEEDEESPFKKIIDEIIEESKQLKQSLDNLSDSRFFLAMTGENIERLCSEPYTSLISLEISLANLHSNRVIHFSKEALNRHKSVANLSQSIKNLNKLKQVAQSNYDLVGPRLQSPANLPSAAIPQGPLQKIVDTKVVVERQKPRRQKMILPPAQKSIQSATTESESGGESQASSGKYKPVTRLQISKKLDNKYDAAIDQRNFMNSQTSIKEEDIPDDPPTSLMPDVGISASRQYDIDSQRCHSCLWPRTRAHLKPIISSQRIQQSWIEDNLMNDFEQNVGQIEEHAFKHGLWLLLLRCLAHQNKIDDYITCCVLLDDVRLLNTEQMNLSLSGEDDPIVDKLLEHLMRRTNRIVEANNEDKTTASTCYKCNTVYPEDVQQDDINELIDEYTLKKEDDEFSFNLVNLFEQSMMHPNVNIKKLVGRLLNYPQLLNKSKIPANFYLKTLTVAVAIANQSPLSRARLDRLKGSSEAIMNQ